MLATSHSLRTHGLPMARSRWALPPAAGKRRPADLRSSRLRAEKIGVYPPRDQNRTNSIDLPRRCSSSSSICVDLPAPSTPLKAMIMKTGGYHRWRAGFAPW